MSVYRTIGPTLVYYKYLGDELLMSTSQLYFLWINKIIDYLLHYSYEGGSIYNGNVSINRKV